MTNNKSYNWHELSEGGARKGELYAFGSRNGVGKSMWPFPSYPAKEWTKKQVKDYEDKQRQQTPDAPM